MTGSKSDRKKPRAEDQDRVTSCMCLCRTKVSPHLAPHPKNNHTVIRRQCCETFQASCNLPSILQRANFLATSQHLLNVPTLTSYKNKMEHNIASRPSQKVTGKSSEQSIKSVPWGSFEERTKKLNSSHLLSCPLTAPPHFISFLVMSCVRPGCLTRDRVG